MSHRDCSRCLVADRCIYPHIFETPAPLNVLQFKGHKQAPHPFILVPPVANPFHCNDYYNGGKDDRLAPPSGLNQTPDLRKCSAPVLANNRNFSSGDRLLFDLILMGRAIDYLPYMIYAVTEMGESGLGASRARFKLDTVSLIDGGARVIIYDGGTSRISVPPNATKSLKEIVCSRLKGLGDRDRVKINFITPTRIRVDGDLKVEMNFELLARNLLRRISMLTATYGEAPLEMDFRAIISRASSVQTRSASLSWWDWERYSNRQKVKMKLGGFIGQIEYSGEAVNELLPLLAAGEILHVGSGTSFGLGQYQIL